MAAPIPNEGMLIILGGRLLGHSNMVGLCINPGGLLLNDANITFPYEDDILTAFGELKPIPGGFCPGCPPHLSLPLSSPSLSF
jgi:hypothetical protein